MSVHGEETKDQPLLPSEETENQPFLPSEKKPGKKLKTTLSCLVKKVEDQP
jgi:hypothetical protein